VGTIAATYQRFPHIGPVLPAMGYGGQQRHDLADTVERAEPDAVVVGTPLDLMRLLDLAIPNARVFYDVAEVGTPTLADVLRDHGITGRAD
jgi:predicted GTPase